MNQGFPGAMQGMPGMPAGMGMPDAKAQKAQQKAMIVVTAREEHRKFLLTTSVHLLSKHEGISADEAFGKAKTIWDSALEECGPQIQDEFDDPDEEA